MKRSKVLAVVIGLTLIACVVSLIVGNEPLGTALFVMAVCETIGWSVIAFAIKWKRRSA